MKIRFQFLTILLVVTVLLSGISGMIVLCEPAQAATPETVKIGVIFYDFGLTVVNFQRQAMNAIKDELGVELIELSSDWDAQKELALFEDLVAKKVDAIILQPVSQDAAGHLVQMGHNAGIPVISFDGLAKKTDTDAYVTAWSEKVGEMQAQYALDQLGTDKPLKVAILEGEAGDDIAERITFGNYTVFNKYPNVEVVVDQKHPAWDKDKAMATAENALAKYCDQLNVIIANNDMMAMGALQAVKAAGLLGKVMVIGADADLDALLSIKAGELAATVNKDPIEMGDTVLRVANRIARKLPIADGIHITEDDIIMFKNGDYDVPMVVTSVEFITKDNLSKMKYRYPDAALD